MKALLRQPLDASFRDLQGVVNIQRLIGRVD